MRRVDADLVYRVGKYLDLLGINGKNAISEQRRYGRVENGRSDHNAGAALRGGLSDLLPRVRHPAATADLVAA